MVGCGSINPGNTTTTSTSTNQPPPQTNTPGTTNAGGSTGSNSFSPNQPFTTQNPNTNIGKGAANQLTKPTAFNYQINPATPSVDISKDSTQKINSQVTNSFGQGVPDIPVSIQVKDPSGKTAALFTGKTDNDGKNVVSFPVKTAGTWTALVVISSSSAAGGPFSDQITWNAMSGPTSSNLTSATPTQGGDFVLPQTSPSQYVSAVDGKCPPGSREVGGSSGNAGQPGTGSIICRLDNPSVTSPPATTPTNNPLTTARQDTVLNTVNKQTCPPLPIDANGRCPGIDMRGGGLGLPPVPPSSSAQVPNEHKKRECSNFAPGQVDEVYYDIYLNKCMLAIVPQSNGQCITSYVKNVDGTLCEP